MSEDNIYLRQKPLNLHIPDSATIVGVGGIGAWMALNLSLTGVKKIILIDNDIIEEHNLNRTPFTLSQVGLPKVEALTELIIERRGIQCEVIPFKERVEKLLPEDYEADFIIDCRDNKIPLKVNSKQVRLGYDGFKVTLHFNPSESSIWGDGPVRYTTVPSWLVPPQLAACLVTTVLCSMPFPSKEIIKTFNVRDLVKSLLNL